MPADTQPPAKHSTPSLIEILLGLTGCGVFLLGLLYTAYTILAKTITPLALLIITASFVTTLLLFALVSIIGHLRKLNEKA